MSATTFTVPSANRPLSVRLFLSLMGFYSLALSHSLSHAQSGARVMDREVPRRTDIGSQAGQTVHGRPGSPRSERCASTYLAWEWDVSGTAPASSPVLPAEVTTGVLRSERDSGLRLSDTLGICVTKGTLFFVPDPDELMP